MGENKKKTQTSSSTTRSPWLTEGSQQAVGMARDIATRSYSNYDGQRIADLSQNEQMGLSGFQNEFGRYDADYNKARGSLDSMGSITDEGALEGYMNPYMEEVLNPAVRRRNRDYGANQAELSRTAGMRGAFGGRKNVMENELQRQHQEGLDDMYGSAYGAAFDRATGLFGQEQDRKLQQASAYSGIAGAESRSNSQILRNMMDSGLVERTQEQADLDFQYLEHLEERDWDVTNLNTLVQTLGAVPHDIKQDSTTVETSKPSAIKTITGIAAITAGAIMTGGMSLAAMGTAFSSAGTGLLAGEEA